MSSKVQVLKQNTQQAIIDQEKILLKKFSVSLKGSRPTENEYYSLIKENNDIQFAAAVKERIGFYKVGQLLLHAKKHLKGDYVKLQKKLHANKIIHLRNQQRMVELAENPRIQKVIYRLPPVASFAKFIMDLPEQDFIKIENKINREVTKKDILELLPEYDTDTGKKKSNKDIKNELIGISLLGSYYKESDKEKLVKCSSEIKSIIKKYKFLQYNEQPMLDQTINYKKQDKKKEKLKKRSIKFDSRSKKSL